MKKSRMLSNITFLDILFNALIVFIAIVALIKINPEDSKKAVELEGEYLITVKWEPGSEDDVDVYVMDPAENIVYFQGREAGLMYLDHDDLGARSDTTKDAEGNIIFVIENVEHVTINGVMSGEYIVNVHMYAKESLLPMRVEVILTRIHKKTREIIKKEIVLSEKGDEKTAFRFTLDADGDVASINYLERLFVRKAHDRRGRE